MQLIITLFFSLIAFFVVLKFLLWLRIVPERNNFLRSFFSFYSKHDAYDAFNNAESFFIKCNNAINVILYAFIAALVICYILDTEDVNGLVPTKREAIDYKTPK